MERTKTTLFMVNDKPLLAPDEDMSFSYEDIDAADAGRTEDGVMHRAPVRYKVGKWSFNYKRITEEDMRYIESLFDDASEFDFKHPYRKDSRIMVTSRCYRSKYSLAWKSAKDGIWHNYTFNIIEC